MKLLFSNRVSKAFADKVNSISGKLGIEPDWLMFLMDWESAGSFRPSIENSFGCIGLIQFCPDYSGGEYKTIGGVQYKMSIIKSMSSEDQLELVYEYLKEQQKTYGRFSTYHDLYLSILFPVAIGKPDDYVLNTQSNPVFDINKNGQVTAGEVKQYLDNRVREKVSQQYWNTFFKKKTFCSFIKQRSLLAA